MGMDASGSRTTQKRHITNWTKETVDFGAVSWYTELIALKRTQRNDAKLVVPIICPFNSVKSPL